MLDRIKARIKNKEFLRMLAIVTIVLAMLFGVAKVEMQGGVLRYATHVGHKGEEQFIYNLSNGDVIEQEFGCDTSFDMITLHFSDHDQMIEGKTIISITEKTSGELIYYAEKENSDIHYGELVEIPFETPGVENEQYILKLCFEGMQETGLGIFGFQVDEDESAALLNGKRIEYRVAVGMHTYTDLFYRLVYAMFIVVVFMLILCVILVTQTKVKEEYLFLSIAVPVGIAFLMLFSINDVHDGGTHLAKTYHFSNVLLGKAEQDVAGHVLLRSDEAQAFEEIYEDNHRENNVANMCFDTVNQFWDKSDAQEWTLSHQYRETSASSIFEYFPSAIGMTIGRIMGGSARFNIFLVKIFSFLFYIGMVFVAVKIAPYYKSVIAFAALLPMSLYQATGITYDTVVMAVSMVILAIFLESRVRQLSSKMIAVLWGLSFVLGCCKGGVYLVLLLLFFTTNKELYGGLKKKCVTCLGSIGFGGLGVLITSIRVYVSYILGVFENIFSKTVLVAHAADPAQIMQTGSGVEASVYGIGYVFSNTMDFVKILMRTLAEKADSYIGSLIGYRMAWTDITVDWMVVFAFLILVLLACSDVGEERPKFSMREKIIYLCMLCVEIIGFHALMLVETPIGSKVIEGVQGRYFLEWVPVVGLVVAGNHIKCDSVGARRLFCYFSIAEAIYLYFFIKIFLGIV